MILNHNHPAQGSKQYLLYLAFWMDWRKKMREYTEVRTSRQEPGYGLRLLAYKITELTWLFFIILEVLIGLRVIMRLIGANPASLFVALLYG